MSILVTGGAGYIGSHTVLELLRKNYEVVVLDNFSNSSRKSLIRVAEIAGCAPHIVQGDIRNNDIYAEIFGEHEITSVIHFAGLKSVGVSVERPLNYYDNNVNGSIQLFKAMKKYNVKNIVFSSSATVYGDPISLPLTEDMPTGKPTNPYGMSKLIIEDILKDWSASDPSLSVTLLRYFNPVGAHPSGKIGENPTGIPNNLMPFICQTALGLQKTLKVFGDDYDTLDGTGIRDFIHVCDLAEGHTLAVEHCKQNTGVDIYNLGTGKGTSVLQLVNTFEIVNGVKIHRTISGRRDGDVAACYADVSKIKSHLGWECKLGIERMCKDAWLWQKNNPTGYN
jgi:UDP-glucose 4-epimerase